MSFWRKDMYAKVEYEKGNPVERQGRKALSLSPSVEDMAIVLPEQRVLKHASSPGKKY
jgi:hypothetical protein